MASVLVLEDDEDMRALLCELLVMSGVDGCVEAGSVRELEACGERVHRAQLALLDINLGAGNPTGLDAYEWLVRQRYGGQVVFITGHAATHPELRAAERLHGVRVLMKPVDPDVLIALLPDEQGAPMHP